ncbi:MAG: SUMF1/EgtB/PvdO family nonheme iron enzyme [Magnetococcales bacterium]|nr:SUMF1/EgtB/PvdO family nonheme iron enzyme [Magnetococcales bacterium]
MKYSKGFFNRSDNNKRRPQAVRRSGASRSEAETSRPARWRFPRTIPIRPPLPVIFLLALGCGWGLLWLLQPPTPGISWQACLEQQQNAPLYPTLIEIPAGTFEIPKESSTLTPFMKFHDRPDIVLEHPLLLQSREVDREQFKRYVEEIENIQDFEERQRRKLRIGTHWDHNDVQDSSVRHLSWEGATDYAQWFSRKTGCDYRLPTREEWAAAVLHAASQGQKTLMNAVDAEGLAKNLLFGAREWSQTSCADGFLLLGGDDWTASADEQQEICMSPMLAMGGFRLVLNPSSIPNPARPTANPLDPPGNSLKMDAELSLDRAGPAP